MFDLLAVLASSSPNGEFVGVSLDSLSLVFYQDLTDLPLAILSLCRSSRRSLS